MTTGPTTYFLLVHRRGCPLGVEAFDDERSAAEAYSAREHALRDERDVEVVLVGADSIETVRTTHSHYFAEAGDLLTDLRRELVAAEAP